MPIQSREFELDTLHRISLLLLILIVLIIHSNSLLNNFTYDDSIIIAENQQHLNKIENIPLLITKRYFYISKEGSYRPVVTLSYFLDQHIGGGSPFQYHLTNLLLHITNVLLIYCLILALSKDQCLSLTSSLIYSVHPVLTEVINGIGFRDDSLATMFFLISILSFIKKRIGLSIATYAIALLSKESALVLPLLIFIYNRLYDKGIRFANYIGYIVATSAYMVLRFYFFYNPAEKGFITPFSLEEKIISVPAAVLYYLKLMLFPLSLRVDYAPYYFLTLPGVHFVALANILSMFAIIFLFKGKNRFSKFGLYWFFITLIPVLNLVAIGNPFAERYLYLPSIGLVMFGVSFLFEKWNFERFALMTLLSLTVILYATLASSRNALWKDNQTLWQDTLNKSPLSARSYNNLAASLLANKDYEKAIPLLESALKSSPDSVLAHTNLGVAYLNKGKLEYAEKEFRRAIELDPYFPGAYLNLGIVYEKKEEIELAMSNYRKVLSIEPDNPKAHLYLGVLIGRKGKIEDAIKEFKSVLDFDTYLPEAHYNIGIAYELQKKDVEASEEFVAELNLNPSHSKARMGLARTYIRNGLFDAAEAHLRTISEGTLEYPEAKYSLERLGKIREQNSHGKP